MLRRLINNKALIYLLGELFSKLSPFIALPLLTRALSPEEYAIYSLFSVTVFFGYILSSMATASYIPIVYFKDNNELKSTIKTVISVSNTVLLITILILGPFFFYIESLAVYVYCILGALIVGYLSVGFQIVLSLYQCEQKARKYVLLNIVRSTIFLLLVFFAFYTDVSESKYYILLYGFSYVLFLPYVSFNLISRFGLNVFKFSINKKVLYFGLPSIPNALANWFKTSLDRYAILFVLGVGQLGHYSVAYQLAFGSVVISSALGKAMNPGLYQKLNRNGFNAVAKKYCMKYFLLFFLISTSYSGFLYFFSDLFVDPMYLNVNFYSSLLVFSALFQGGSSFFIGVIFYNERVKYALLCNVLSIMFHFSFISVLFVFELPLVFFVIASVLSSFIYFLFILRGVNEFYIKTA